MGQMRGARFDRYCIIEVVLVHLTADIHTRARARHFFAWASAPHLGRDGDGTGLACVFALCLILYLGWEHGFGGNGAAYKHSLYLVLYKYIYKMRVNPLG